MTHTTLLQTKLYTKQVMLHVELAAHRIESDFPVYANGKFSFIILTLEHGKKFFGGRFIGYAIFLYASVGAHIS